MAMGKRKRNRQRWMWVATTDFPTAASHPFYTRLNQLLRVIDLTLRKGDEVRRLRFLSPSQVCIDAGFCGQCSGLAIHDIRSRGWDRITVEVRNVEQNPGITFLAASVVDLDAVE